MTYNIRYTQKRIAVLSQDTCHINLCKRNREFMCTGFYLYRIHPILTTFRQRKSFNGHLLIHRRISTGNPCFINIFKTDIPIGLHTESQLTTGCGKVGILLFFPFRTISFSERDWLLLPVGAIAPESMPGNKPSLRQCLLPAHCFHKQ